MSNCRIVKTAATRIVSVSVFTTVASELAVTLAFFMPIATPATRRVSTTLRHMFREFIKFYFLS